jgi:hypothetical protein
MLRKTLLHQVSIFKKKTLDFPHFNKAFSEKKKIKKLSFPEHISNEVIKNY